MSQLPNNRIVTERNGILMAKIVVIGGGAAGMMAAYAASLKKHEVILLERNEKLGKKVFITGKGRCNVTNACDTSEFFQNVISNPKFLYSSIYGFDAFQVMELLENNGCKLKIERGQRVFPVSDHSSDIIQTMEKILLKQKVVIRKHCYVKNICTETVVSDTENCSAETTEPTANAEKKIGIEANAVDRKTNINEAKSVSIETKANEVKKVRYVEFVSENGTVERLDADAVILATGGCSYQSTGSDGNGIILAEELGHLVVKQRPGLVPFVIREEMCKNLQGLSLKNVSLTLNREQKVIYEGFGEMLFTHFGISGPLILSASSYFGKNHKPGNYTVHIDLKPALTFEKLDQRMLRELEENNKKQLKSIMPNLLPGKLAAQFPELCNIEPERVANRITREERLRLVERMKDLTLHVTGTRGFEEAIITMGGVDVKQINPSTMESKVVQNLFFAGEMMDVDALTGGFNLQIAWSTGYLAGSSAAEKMSMEQE